MNDGVTTSPLELHGRGQAGDLLGLIIARHHVGNDAVLSRWDLLWQFHTLRERGLALLNRALQIDILDGVAKVGGLLDDGDQAVLDLQVDGGAFGDVLREGACCRDLEGSAAGKKTCELLYDRRGLEMGVYVSRLRGVRVQINALQLEDVVLGVLAVLERVLARHVELLVPGRDLDAAAEEARPRRHGSQEGGAYHGEDLHLCCYVGVGEVVGGDVATCDWWPFGGGGCLVFVAEAPAAAAR